jgi:hypothetical protein
MLQITGFQGLKDKNIQRFTFVFMMSQRGCI